MCFVKIIIMKIVIGEEYKIKIENGNDFDESIFKDVYKQAARSVEEIVIQSKVKNKSSISSDNYNNIIAFTGERGTGKSSSMISFAEALIHQKEESHSSFFEKNKFEKIRNKDIISIDVIDPSLFKGEDKLFEIIISKMFSSFQKRINESKNNEINHDQKRKLIKHFQHVFNNLKIVHNGKSQVYEKEAIEALSDLAYGTNLKTSFFELVDTFLKYIGNNSDFLLIAIDDFDLNIRGAFDMLEDIRQFLIQKNIILLIACKIEQLQDSTNHEIIKNFKTIINFDTNQNVLLSEDIHDKSSRYLDKLLPIERRIQTPSFNINNTSGNVEIIDSSNNENINSFIGKSIEGTIIELIYKKTGHIITINNFEQNVIIPTTIREITNTIAFLNRAGDIDAFKKYLFKGINGKLPKRYINFFNELENTPDKMLNIFIANWIGGENKTLLAENKLGKNYSRLLFEEIEDPREHRRISSSNIIRPIEIKNITEAVNYANISYGDLKALLKELDTYKLISDKTLLNFYSYIELYYSYRITKSYRSKKYLRSLINGALTNKIHLFFPKEGNRMDARRDEFSIYKKPTDLVELIGEIEGLNYKRIEYYYWLTFFFTTLGKTDVSFRSELEIIHETKVIKPGSPFDSVDFNAISFLYNTINPVQSLERFVNSSIKEDAMQTHLYNEMKEWSANLSSSSNYIEIFNFQLFDEFLEEIRKNANRRKETFDSYGDRLYEYIVSGISSVTESLKTKYTYLNFDELVNNPFLLFWKSNKEDITKVLNLVFSLSEKPSEDNVILKRPKYETKTIYTLNKYLTNLQIRPTKTTTMTNFIKQLILAESPGAMIDRFKIMRANMTNKSREEQEDIAQQAIKWIKRYLAHNG